MDQSRAAEADDAAEGATAAAGIVLLSVASAQFLMTLGSSVMNVSIAAAAKDVGCVSYGCGFADHRARAGSRRADAGMAGPRRSGPR
jgi:hypothetical protein